MHDITGLNGTKCLTSKYAVPCILSSANEAHGEEVTILVHMVDCITSDYGPNIWVESVLYHFWKATS